MNGNGTGTENTDILVVGAGGEYKPKDTGGAKEVTLTIDQMPAHTITVNDLGSIK